MNSRTRKTFKNAIVGIICQIITLIINFVSRTVFIKLLGADYLGINGLFSNILNYLSLAELGFGSAIVYNLYRFLAEDNKEKVVANINFYGKIYKLVALFIFVFGIALIPFLQYIVKFQTDTGINYRLYYFMFLMQSVMSYLFVYKSCIFSADQKQYLIDSYSTFFSIFTKILQLIFLWFTHSYFVYLLISIIIQLLNNIYIYMLAEKYYPYLKNKKTNLTKIEKKDILENVKSLFLSKIGVIIVNHTSNIFISFFVSTTMVGYYSNYVMITGMVTSFANLLFGGIGASIGNFLNTNTKKEATECLYMINFAYFWIFCVITICMFFSINDFIVLWIGKEYNLGIYFSFILLVNLFFIQMNEAVCMFNYSAGMFKKTKYVTLLTALLNIILSLILGKKYGIYGIILSIFLSRCFSSFWLHPLILFKYYLHTSVYKYFLNMCIYYILTIFFIIAIFFLKKTIFIHTWLELIYQTFIVFIIVNLILFLIFNKYKYFNMIKIRFSSLLKLKRYKNE